MCSPPWRIELCSAKCFGLLLCVTIFWRRGWDIHLVRSTGPIIQCSHQNHPKITKLNFKKYITKCVSVITSLVNFSVWSASSRVGDRIKPRAPTYIQGAIQCMFILSVTFIIEQGLSKKLNWMGWSFSLATFPDRDRVSSIGTCRVHTPCSKKPPWHSDTHQKF